MIVKGIAGSPRALLLDLVDTLLDNSVIPGFSSGARGSSSPIATRRSTRPSSWAPNTKVWAAQLAAGREDLYVFLYRNMIHAMARATTTSDAFNAIAEPQRRAILTLLRGQDRPVTEVADSLGLRVPATSKHLRVLREVGLVHVRRAGKQRVYGLDARGLQPVHEWLGGFERFWNESFDRLDAYVRQLERRKEQDGRMGGP